jgi:hypothetical protein
MDQRIWPVGPLLLKLLCQFLLDSVLHTVLPQGIRPQFGEQLPKMIIEDHPHHFAVVEAGTALRMAVQAATKILTVRAVTEILAVQAVTEILTVQAVTETLTVQAVTEILTVQAVTENVIVPAATGIMIVISETMTVAAGTGTTTGPGILKKEEIAKGRMTIAETDAPAHVIGAEAGVAAGAEARV